MSLDVAVRKRFGRAFALDVAFETEGACLGILGASGCGKSATLRCIAGIERPDSGRIVLNGRVLFDSERGVDLRPQERRVGYLFQDYALFPRMTVAENVAAGMPRGKAGSVAVAALLGGFRLESLGDRRPDELSGGQRQRVALARMLAARPDAVLLDEPFSALDAHLREYMQLKIRDMIGKMGDAVMVTHSRDEVYRLCPRLLAMDGGRVLAAGSTREIFDDPRLLSVAKLTGCKNISRAERLSAGRIRAIDWNMELTTAREVDGATTHVGVRAHEFRPFSPGLETPAGNVVAIRILGRTEDPFETNVHFANAAAGVDAGTERLWWKVSKYALRSLPTHLYVPEDAVMPLRDDGA